MTFDADTLFGLLPSIHRIRDRELAASLRGLLTAAEAAELDVLEAVPNPTVAQQERLEVLRDKLARGPLKALLVAFADEVAVVEENLSQLYDDLFVETCGDWVVPYIGDLLGSETLNALGRGPGLARAEVAHTIALRRRKGTAAVLEQLARDVTGWSARAVEYFHLLATTQYMNHLRLGNVVTPSLRDGEVLEWVGTAFDPIPRRLDVRRIASRRGRYNIPNVGIFLWRVEALRLQRSPAAPDPTDASGRRFRFSPLGNDTPLYTRPEAEDEITHIADPINVPAPIRRRVLDRHLAQYYGEGKSLHLHFGSTPVSAADIVVCNLGDHGGGWAHDAPAGKVAIDPLLGRLVVAADVVVAGPLRATYHYGAPGNLGGGEYPRAATFESPLGGIQHVPNDHLTIQAAIDALGGTGVVEITDNERYEEALTVDVGAGGTIELRAALERRPTLDLSEPMTLTGKDGAVVLSGLVIGGDGVTVPSGSEGLRRLRLVHTTLVPGIALSFDGMPVEPGAPSLTVDRPDVEVTIERSIVGAVRIHPGSKTRVAESVIDACSSQSVAYGSPGGADPGPGGALSVEASSVIGATRCQSLEASNTLLLGKTDVVVRQKGCVRFSFVPPGSLTPRRFHCQPSPGDGMGNLPHFTSLRYGAPAYCQLTERTPPAIRRGADDESEMGVLHFLFQPQREANLVARLDEYLRVGLQAGIFYES